MSSHLQQKKKMVSLVIPVFNEETNIDRFYERVCAVIKSFASQYEFEFVFTDNHSSDKTFVLLQSLAKNDGRVRVCRFSKNFGYQNSILMGYHLASGDAAIQLDCDLQDPPELIEEFLGLWEQGYQVVYGVRRTREEGVFIGLIRSFFYRFINYLSDDDLPLNAGDFRLLDRRIIDEVVSSYDASPYLRGYIASLGFRQIGVPYDRAARASGESKFSMAGLFSLAVDGILGHSLAPLRFAFGLGIVTLTVSVLAGLTYLFLRLFFAREWPPGFTTLTLLILGSTSINLIFTGILGAYIGRIYLQVKRRPNVVVQDSVNLYGAPSRFPVVEATHIP